MGTERVPVCDVCLGGVKGATDKHFRKGKIDTLEPRM